VSKKGGQKEQIALSSALGGWRHPERFDDKAGLPVDKPVSGYIDWSKLENWSPSGGVLLAPSGELVTKDGDVLDVKVPHLWAGWRR
jgi:hypothetical protein